MIRNIPQYEDKRYTKVGPCASTEPSNRSEDGDDLTTEVMADTESTCSGVSGPMHFHACGVPEDPRKK